MKSICKKLEIYFYKNMISFPIMKDMKQNYFQKVSSKTILQKYRFRAPFK